ncbi:MAG: hypothetical protein QOC82_1909 [Frankiaceae bacterium]|jgi:hypothetical protein|nr:hypothetical protein [Frankiaceae bacterium]
MTALATLKASWHGATTNPPDRSNLNDPNRRRYLKSFLLLRVLIGAIGIALPILTYLGTALLPGGHFGTVRGSLSSYYYSGMREFFTCALAITGVFLMTYKAFQRELENYLTLLAGFAIVLVAFFPTDRPSGTDVGPTALQDAFGETAVATVHFVSAIIFIAALAVISYCFGEREGKRAVRRGHRSPEFWKTLHHSCAGAIAVAGIFYAARKFGHLPCGSWINAHDLWLTEVVAVAAFATSWLFKGSEIAQL